MSRVRKRSMWNPPRDTVGDGIIALDEKRLVRSLRVLEVPLVLGIRLDSVGLAVTVWVNQRGGNEIALVYGIGVREGEGVSEDGLDGTPNVDDLKALLEKLIRFIWEVVLDTALGGCVGLVNVNSFSWPTELGGSVADVSWCTADGVVKDENAVCSSDIFQELFHLWIVFRLDLLVVKEILLLALMLHKLEAMAVEGVFILVSRNVVDNDALGSMRALGSILLANVERSW